LFLAFSLPRKKGFFLSVKIGLILAKFLEEFSKILGYQKFEKKKEKKNPTV
jgi:hypothetical protein